MVYLLTCDIFCMVDTKIKLGEQINDKLIQLWRSSRNVSKGNFELGGQPLKSA